mgnify:FL=1
MDHLWISYGYTAGAGSSAVHYIVGAAHDDALVANIDDIPGEQGYVPYGAYAYFYASYWARYGQSLRDGVIWYEMRPYRESSRVQKSPVDAKRVQYSFSYGVNNGKEQRATGRVRRRRVVRQAGRQAAATS